jgi:hypothetical protein
VPITSESVSSDGISALSLPTLSVGILELDKVSYLPFAAFVPAACAPGYIFGPELVFPLGKGVRPADIEANVIQHGLASRTRGQAMWIAIDPQIRRISIGRVGGRQTKHVMGKIREGFAIRRADADLHDLFNRTHGKFPFAKKPRRKYFLSIDRRVQPCDLEYGRLSQSL